jgi:hypothetical protein
MTISLDAGAKAAEIVGAIAVVTGLLFVGLEIRSNTTAQRFSATQVLVSEYNNAIKVTNDKEFVCIYTTGSNDFASLTQQQKIRYSVFTLQILRTFEQLHYAAVMGIIDPNIYSGFERQLAALMQSTGYQQYWAVRRQWFGELFQSYVDGVISDRTAEPANFAFQECNVSD